MCEEFLHALARRKLRLEHINNWGNGGAFGVQQRNVPRKEGGEKGCLYVHFGHYGCLNQSGPICLHAGADMMAHRQESFKLISSRPNCLQLCFNEYGSSHRFRLQHLAHRPTLRSNSGAKNSSPLCGYTVVLVGLLEIPLNIFHSHSQSFANKNTVMLHR